MQSDLACPTSSVLRLLGLAGLLLFGGLFGLFGWRLGLLRLLSHT